MHQHRMSVEQMRLVFKTGFRIVDSGLFLFIAPAPDGEHRFMGMVRKKLYKRAVDRNRVRRVLKEAFRQKAIEKSSSALWVVADLRSWEGGLANSQLFHLMSRCLERSD